MPRNNEDFAQGKGIMSNINDSMEMLDGFVSKYTPNIQKKNGKNPSNEDLRDAYFSGKITTEEANDLAGSSRFAKATTPMFGGGDHPHNTRASNQEPSDFALDHEARNAHRRAGLSD